MRNRRLLPPLLAGAFFCFTALGLGATLPSAYATSYTPISGQGSSWAANAIQDWAASVHNSGIQVNFDPQGSVAGLNNFANGTIDFAASDVPYGLAGGATPPPPQGRPFAYIPDVAGGTALMYNLPIGGRQYANLKLSGPTIAGIFSGAITMWNAPQIKADNPGVGLPPLQITPVVRSDPSGSTAQFSLWMKSQFPSAWKCGEISDYKQCQYYNAMKGQAGDTGVAGFVGQHTNAGSIGYVEYSYALQSGYPVAKVLNQSGFYTLPTASNVAVALLKARVNMDKSNPKTYLTQDLSGVYTDSDPRAYPISSYSYFVVPTDQSNRFTTAKGSSLGAFVDYALCTGQQAAPQLGYSPLPINLAEAGLAQVRKIPGAAVQNINIQNCHNPTFSTNGTNTLAINALYPDLCDKRGVSSTCTYGTPLKGSKSSSGSGQGDNNSVGNHNSGSVGSGNVATSGTPGSTGVSGSKGGTNGGAPSNASGSGANGGSGAISLLNPDGRTSCDPDTGQCTQVAASPALVSTSLGANFSQWVVWAALGGLVVLILAPPAVVLLRRKGR
ncbi:MAG TPA: phosphate ABC transporter substrate-binding protein PstS [Marmoricola sp.]|nr:phosphate ABC transporter substrate-binding protein PstS [Marmoricola sp.]